MTMWKFVLVLMVCTCGYVGGKPESVDKCSWCVENAKCEDDNCVCPSPLIGNGYFYCYNPELFDVCQVCDDPVLTTQNNENVALSYFNTTYLVDEFRYGKKGFCRIRIIETREKVKGKNLPRCVRVRLDLKTFLGKQKCSLEFKVTATVDKKCNIQWKIESGFLKPGGEKKAIKLKLWKIIKDTDNKQHTLKLCDCQIQFKVGKGKVLQIDAECCKLKIGVKPVVRKFSFLKGGLYIRFPKIPPQNPPQTIPRNFPLCLRRGYQVSEVAARLGLSSTSRTMSFLAMTNVPGDLVSASPARTAMTDALHNCSTPELEALLNEVDFVYSSAPFIREISGETDGFENLMWMMKKAADWFCEGDELSCQSMLETIKSSANGLVLNPSKHPTLAAFVAKNCTT
ncbi:hypothetical protein RRG08_065175 [Elysia crispata]|uniref:Uncharacterized protein n=1 Tax=Elysia crispata TaxID=231223 RepID=A0AAE0Z091_9GAST|nr:hypothetical protein RRG08_065175 [Elysia crispata]